MASSTASSTVSSLQNITKLECGKKSSFVDVEAEDWPWLIAFMDSSKSKLLTAGSLISHKHVLSGKLLFMFRINFFMHFLLYIEATY